MMAREGIRNRVKPPGGKTQKPLSQVGRNIAAASVDNWDSIPSETDISNFPGGSRLIFTGLPAGCSIATPFLPGFARICASPDARAVHDRVRGWFPATDTARPCWANPISGHNIAAAANTAAFLNSALTSPPRGCAP